MPILGPPVGSFIASYASWRWLFFLKLPAGLLIIVMAWRIVPPPPVPGPRPFDPTCLLLVGGALECLAWTAGLLARRHAGAVRGEPFFEVGAIVFVASIWGLLRASGFRRVMLVDGLLNVASILACALLPPVTPAPVVAAVLFVGGLC
jgi:hypothetical protein